MLSFSAVLDLKFVSSARSALDAWTYEVANGARSILDAVRSRRTIKLAERDDQSFAVLCEDGAQPDTIRIGSKPSGDTTALLNEALLEVELSADRFMFRELELPAKAAEFVSGVVRSHVEKLMPWKPGSAVYGWARVEDHESGERIKATVAGCSVESINGVLSFLLESGAYSFSMFVVDPKSGQRIEVWGQKAARAADVEPIQKRLTTALAATAALALLAIVGASVLSLAYSASGAGLRGSTRSSSGSMTQQRALLVRKRNESAAVLLLENLAKVLPDGTFVTELRLENGKVWISGATTDAASLLLLLGQSDHFSGANFFAPTSRASDGLGELFHIEATLKPGRGLRT